MNARTLTMSTLCVIAWTAGLAAAAVLPYNADFNTGTAAGSAWSDTTISSTPSGERYLGQFGAGTITLDLGAQPAGPITLSFDFYAIQSLDNNGPAGNGIDDFDFSANGTSLFRTNFDNFGTSGQAYPDASGVGNNAPGAGATATNSLGFTFPGSQLGDATYRITLDYLHTGGNLAFGFQSLQGQDVGDEGWGLDNVSVIPAPAAAALLSVGGLLSLRRRSR